MARSAEALVIVLDVGPGVGKEISPNGETFLHNAQLCATKIIQKKIFTQSKDEIGLILLGSEDTNNPLADEDGYNNIEIVHRLQSANWEMVHTIRGFKESTTVDGDWMDALIVAADFMKTETEGKQFKERKIVYFTNFRSDVSDDEVNGVITGLQNENIELIVIGPQVYKSNTQKTQFEGTNKSKGQLAGEALIVKITEEVTGSVICSFEDALYQLRFYGTKKVRPTPWKTIMDIGSNIRIPISAFKKIAEVKPFVAHDVVIPTKLKAASASSSQALASQGSDVTDDKMGDDIEMQNDEVPDGTRRHKTAIQNDDDFGDSQNFDLVDKDRIYRTLGDEATPVDTTELIQGYMFGETLVPVTEDDKPALLYESGPRSLSVLGFTSKDNVPLCYLKGECNQVFPQKEENSIRAFAALIQAMDRKNMVAIARKVYNNNNAPVICALFPMISSEIQCFNLVELPFSENVNTFLFPPLIIDKNRPTEKQLSAVDELINSMNLMEQYEDGETEEYNPHDMSDPYEEHYYSVIAKKILNGELYISGNDVDEAVKLLLSPKEELLEAAKPAIEKIKERFALTKVTPKEGARNAAADIFKPDTKALDIDDVKGPQQITDSKDAMPHIGTIRPDEEFTSLLKDGVSLNKACCLLAQVITGMVLKAFDADDFTKPFKCLKLMRTTCADKDPTVYNDWITTFRKDLPDEKVGFWQLIVNDEAGLISTSESSLSKINVDEAKRFLQVDDVNDATLPTQGVDEDMDDLVSDSAYKIQLQNYFIFFMS